MARITIDADAHYWVGFGREKGELVSFESIVPFLQENYGREGEIYVALYAEKTIPYMEVIRVLDLVNQNNFKMILVTHPK